MTHPQPGVSAALEPDERDVHLSSSGRMVRVGSLLLNYSEAYQLREDLTAALQQMVQPDPQ